MCLGALGLINDTTHVSSKGSGSWDSKDMLAYTILLNLLVVHYHLFKNETHDSMN